MKYYAGQFIQRRSRRRSMGILLEMRHFHPNQFPSNFEILNETRR